MAAKMAMMAMTTKSSINVNAEFFCITACARTNRKFLCPDTERHYTPPLPVLALQGYRRTDHASIRIVNKPIGNLNFAETWTAWSATRHLISNNLISCNDRRQNGCINNVALN